jgi:ABC-type Mn2+/Zn2+ transport system permease subunit
MPADTMLWIAALFPIVSFVIGLVFYALWRNAWIPTVLVLIGLFAVLWFLFSIKFWPWILLYVFLTWIGCWAGHVLRNRRQPS